MLHVDVAAVASAAVEVDDDDDDVTTIQPDICEHSRLYKVALCNR